LPAYERVVSRLRSLDYNVTGRPAKSTTALADKLERQHARLSQVQDIAGCRVVVEDVFLQEAALAAMEVYLDTPAVFDRRIHPSHGYRAVHLIAQVDGRRVEVQLRTELQHLWAEISEKLSDIVDPALKYGVGSQAELEFLRNLSQAIFKIEEVEAARRDFMADLQQRKLTVDKKAKKQIRQMERGFFNRRSQLLQLLRDVHGEFNSGAAT
jgi:ppGpp synthetase/RelA/SpoT-type nucleotidyltranferase